jgi:hypothetical protein
MTAITYGMDGSLAATFAHRPVPGRCAGSEAKKLGRGGRLLAPGSAEEFSALLIRGSLHQTSKIVRLDSLQKPIAFRKPTAIPLCNADFQGFGQMQELLHKPSFAQRLRPSGEVAG